MRQDKIIMGCELEYIKKFSLVALFLALIFFDQLVKYVIRFNGGFYFCNENMALGIYLPPYIFWFFWLATVLAAFGFLFFQKKLFYLQKLALVFILGGAISNFIDRIQLGCVVDFIDVGFFPIFNAADFFICAGAAIILAKTVKCDIFYNKAE